MPFIDPAWQGDVNFYELVFGTWLAYAFLVLLWERLLRVPLPEWQYLLLTFLGASFYWVNHYFQHAPFYAWLLYGYTLLFLLAWYRVAVAPWPRRWPWKLGATLAAVLFTVAFIAFENIARAGVRHGLQEFWFMAIAYPGFLWLIWWRGPRRQKQSN